MSKEHQDDLEGELFEHHKIIADKGQDFLRIDKFLVDRIPNTSRNKIKQAAEAGNILVNDKMVKANYKVHPNDVVSIVLPYPPRQVDLQPEDIPLDILFEDDHLIIVNKQAGLVVHPGYGNFTGTMVNALLHHFGTLPSRNDGFEDRPGIVHRLDKDTTGVMVVAKSEIMLTKLSKLFFDRDIDRSYYALVWGNIEEDEGTIEGNIGRSLKNRKIMEVFPNGEFGKYAKTNFKVVERFGYVTLVECRLETGRTHQIRVHMKYIGHPLFNDADYGGDKILKGTTFTKYRQFVQNCFSMIPRQSLHAKTLGFVHPITGKSVNFDSDLPEDLSQVIEKWRNFSKNSQE